MLVKLGIISLGIRDEKIENHLSCHHLEKTLGWHEPWNPEGFIFRDLFGFKIIPHIRLGSISTQWKKNTQGFHEIFTLLIWGVLEKPSLELPGTLRPTIYKWMFGVPGKDQMIQSLTWLFIPKSHQLQFTGHVWTHSLTIPNKGHVNRIAQGVVGVFFCHSANGQLLVWGVWWFGYFGSPKMKGIVT